MHLYLLPFICICSIAFPWMLAASVVKWWIEKGNLLFVKLSADSLNINSSQHSAANSKVKFIKRIRFDINLWYITQLWFSNLFCSQDNSFFNIVFKHRKKLFCVPFKFLAHIWIFSLSLYFQSLSRFGQNMFLQKFLLTIYQSTAEWEQTNTEHDSVLVVGRDKMWSLLAAQICHFLAHSADSIFLRQNTVNAY